MKQMKHQKPLAFLLALVMILSLLPAVSSNVYAADAAETAQYLQTDGSGTITYFAESAVSPPVLLKAYFRAVA